VRTIIAGLVFAPGLCGTALSVWYDIAFNHDAWVTRWQLVYYLQGEGALRCLEEVSKITAIYLGVCLLLEYFPRRAVPDGERGAVRVIRVWPSLVAIQMALIATAVYLYNYNTLEYAVTNDNLALAEKRLKWNLEGLGPNNGLVADFRGPMLYPLLPVAVKNGDYEMVKLLVKHGADLNPKDWDECWSPESGTYVKSTLYFAVENHDVEMIDFLIGLGVTPEQGMLLALTKGDRELVKFLLERGASLEFALGLLKQKGYSQQSIEGIFPKTIPKNQVEAGQ